MSKMKFIDKFLITSSLIAVGILGAYQFAVARLNNSVTSLNLTLTTLTVTSATTTNLAVTGQFSLPAAAFALETVNVSNAAHTQTTSILSDRLGINSSTPLASLAVQGKGSLNPVLIASSSGSALLIMLTNGNIGVNSSSPVSLFSVQGTSTLLQEVGIGVTANNNNILTIRPNRTYSNSASTGGAVNIDNTANGREAFVIYQGATAIRDGGFGLMRIENVSTTYNDGMLYIVSNSTAGADGDIIIDSPGVDIELFGRGKSTSTGAYEIAIPLAQDVLQINSRNAANSSFENVANFQAYRDGGRMCVGCGTNSLVNGQIHIVAASSTIPAFTIGTSSSKTNILTVLQSGFVGINTSSPTYHLSVSGTIQQQAVVSCATGVQVDASGAFSACVASDERLKVKGKRLSNLTNKELDDVFNGLSSLYYRWKAETKRDDQNHAGFIAQEVQKVFPEAVIPAGNGMLGVDPNALLALMQEKVKRQDSRLKVLEMTPKKNQIAMGLLFVAMFCTWGMMIVKKNK